MAKRPAPAPAEPAEWAALAGNYLDRCGRPLLIERRGGHGWGLYDPRQPYTPALQADANELRRLIAFESLTRLSR